MILRKNIWKSLAIISLALNLVGCADPSAPTKKGPAKVKVSAKAFDVLGATSGENDLDFEQIAQGDLILEETGKIQKGFFHMDYSEVGMASWYGPGFHGKKTASGHKYDQTQYTAAHRDLPLHSVARVINLENQRSVLVVISDRGPYSKSNRIIDVSKKAAQDLGIVNKGIAKVRVEYLHDETMQLMSKFSPHKQARLNAAINKALIKHVTDANKAAAQNKG